MGENIYTGRSPSIQELYNLLDEDFKMTVEKLFNEVRKTIKQTSN